MLSTLTLRVSSATVVIILASTAWSQQRPMSRLERDRAEGILDVISKDVKKHYYDPKFHGVDWDAKVAEAKQKIAKEASFNMAMSYIAAVFDSLNDSHTFLLPPAHAYRVDYGFQYQMVGDNCLVTRVRPGSDAALKGLKPGDNILGIDGYRVSRDDLWKLEYVFRVLRPQGSLRLALQDPSGMHPLDVAAKVHTEKKLVDVASNPNDIWDLIRNDETDYDLMRARYVAYGHDLIALKVPEFFFSEDEVDHIIGKVSGYPNLILDLRGNPGGSVDTLKYLLGGVFDREVKVADRVGRKEAKPEVAKPLAKRYSGKIVVLVDSDSASAAELFARVIQLQKRGIIMGDRSAGAVMEAEHFSELMGADTGLPYGASITEWDLIMSDGKSLEHVGVTPDEIVLPTSQDLAAGRDPVLAHAAESLGVKISPEEAGKAFPYEWPPQ